MTSVQSVLPPLCALVDGDKNSQLPDMAVGLGLTERPKLVPLSGTKKSCPVAQFLQSVQEEQARIQDEITLATGDSQHQRPSKQRKTSRKVAALATSD